MKVGLVQINMTLGWGERREGDVPASVSLFPYSVAMLQAHAERHARDRHEFLAPIHRRMPVAEAVDWLAGADVVGFSAYVWNVRLSLAIAQELKRARPETIVVFGGPQVPDRSEPFLREHPYVDLACHGEGERVFTAVLDAGRDWSALPGVSFLDADGGFHQSAKPPRIADLDEIPSPYLSGTFDALRRRFPEERWVMTWETNRGCPFSCTFCDWGSATAAKVHRFPDERLHAEIDYMCSGAVDFVFCCDANYGMLKRDLELTERIVAGKSVTGHPYSLSVQSAKNATERTYAIQKLIDGSLSSYGATISLQSVNDETLANIRRSNISSESYRELQRRYTREGIYTYTDIILGLPGESYDDFANGVAQVVAEGQHNHVQFHNCSLLPNAEMGHPDYVARFGLRTVDQPIRGIHSPVAEVDEVEERLATVIATDAMHAEDWVRAKTFAWLVDFLYFDRVLQIPFVLLQAERGLSLRALVEAVADADAERFPTLAGVSATMRDHARSIQSGAPEFVPGAGGLHWPADQHALIELVLSERLDAFYAEAIELLGGDPLVDEAVRLNASLFRVPGGTRKPLVLSHDLWPYYRGVLTGAPEPLQTGLVTYVVDARVGEWLPHLITCHGRDKREYLGTARRMQARRPALSAAAGIVAA
ncbi:MAG TPA: cobalamin-dependent protein [Gaiellaceae bacterium]